MTTFCKASAYAHVDYKKLENNNFMVEAVLIQASQGQYY